MHRAAVHLPRRGFSLPGCWGARSPFVTHPHLRGFAAKSTPADAAEKKLKPKATTPLRRAASASLTIRSNPTPTRSDIQPVFTLATAERYLLSTLHDRLPPGSKVLHESLWVPKWGKPGSEGEVFVFGNGAFVCWGLGEAEARRFAKKFLAESTAEVLPLKEVETEDLEFVTDPAE